MAEAVLEFVSRDEMMRVLGTRDQNVRLVREVLGVRLIPRERTLQIEGTLEQVHVAERVFQQLRQMGQQGPVSLADVRTVLDLVRSGGSELTTEAGPSLGMRNVRPRTDGQAYYVRAMQENQVVLCIGPAGSGKTYLAVAMAVHCLKSGLAKRIVLCRPAVEAGERLGYLPGDIAAKVNPFLRPLLDALEDMMEPERVRRYMENDIIEICPLAYMRGRTLNQAVIILDEGQNATVAQMRMFLTRMGLGSKIIVTGDITQVDLPKKEQSGLIDAIHRLRGIEGIAIVELGQKDIVRHPLVQKIVHAYEQESPRRGRPT
ncbi:MAG: PhoH family protein [Gemmatales bacterium]|nr:PhoH family protein [Gemmatales bacterium]MDW7994169.1 PhoH family protein [Gemmatales bacterium]